MILKKLDDSSSWGSFFSRRESGYSRPFAEKVSSVEKSRGGVLLSGGS
jgi:hypothetical protein